MNERMDSAPKLNMAEEERIQTVLTALGSASPDDGFEQRLARRLAAMPVQQQKPVWTWARLRLPLALAGGCAAVLVGAATLQTHSRGHGLRGSNRSTGAAPLIASVVPGRVTTNAVASAPKTARATLTSQVQRGTTAVRPQQESAHAIASLQEASFPAPPMPLTEQEHLLLRVAHRNDPEELAMLNPVERSLQAARERAESAKFFAPAPLPPEIQQQINEALRSQYVNTPPPQELLAQTPNRSTP